MSKTYTLPPAVCPASSFVLSGKGIRRGRLLVRFRLMSIARRNCRNGDPGVGWIPSIWSLHKTEGVGRGRKLADVLLGQGTTLVLFATEFKFVRVIISSPLARIPSLLDRGKPCLTVQVPLRTHWTSLQAETQPTRQRVVIALCGLNQLDPTCPERRGKTPRSLLVFCPLFYPMQYNGYVFPVSHR